MKKNKNKESNIKNLILETYLRNQQDIEDKIEENQEKLDTANDNILTKKTVIKEDVIKINDKDNLFVALFKMVINLFAPMVGDTLRVIILFIIMFTIILSVKKASIYFINKMDLTYYIDSDNKIQKIKNAK